MRNDEILQLDFEGDQISLPRPPYSLNNSDIAGLVAGLAHLRGDWTVERFEDCDGEVCLLLSQQNIVGDALGFSVDRDVTGLRLTAWRGDTHELLGVFVRPQDAFGFMWQLVEAEHGDASRFDHVTFERACQVVVQSSATPPN